jgi:hypothetical protein
MNSRTRSCGVSSVVLHSVGKIRPSGVGVPLGPRKLASRTWKSLKMILPQS